MDPFHNPYVEVFCVINKLLGSVHKYLGGGAGKLGGGQKVVKLQKGGSKKFQTPKKGGSKKFRTPKSSQRGGGGQKVRACIDFQKFSWATPRTPIEVIMFFYIHSSGELEHFWNDII